MCGAYGFSFKDKNKAYKRFNVVNTLDDLEPRYNMRPTQNNPVVVHNSPNKMVRMKWGILRDWSTRPIINATAEKLETSKLWRDLFHFKRCLVPASFFYEPDKSVKPSQPYLFRLSSGELFGLAGLYEEYTDKTTGLTQLYYVIITTVPNEVVGRVHPRSAVILRKEDEETWLNPDIVELERLMPLLTPYPAQEMVSFAVSKRVNSYKNDSEDLIQPLLTAVPGLCWIVLIAFRGFAFSLHFQACGFPLCCLGAFYFLLPVLFILLYPVVPPWDWTPGEVKARGYTITKKGVQDDTTTTIYSRV